MPKNSIYQRIRQINNIKRLECISVREKKMYTKINIKIYILVYADEI
ncbi:MAG: hypothetical protein Satyrvirus24_14 [Satyrvirus sp.]|uniref:Uncharacterized protein n=1 Tax=Satyrvirus sp. TaxID=2487771 RepID=A0A3G5AEH6_9VIRU|nr:MAG: hypothetical protein Satyrvirus24_14 [Satyrvirus sp.]